MLSETEIGFITAAVLFAGYFIIKSHNNRMIRELQKELQQEQTTGPMENMSVEPMRLNGYNYDPEQSLLLAKRAVGDTLQNFVREELYLTNDGFLFFVGKGSLNNGYKNADHAVIKILSRAELTEWGCMTLGDEAIRVFDFMCGMAICFNPHVPARGGKLKKEVWDHLKSCCPISSEDLPVFLCAEAMLDSSRLAYIRPDFLEHVKKMEELTGNTGKWQRYGDLAEPYIEATLLIWDEWKNIDEFQEAFL